MAGGVRPEPEPARGRGSQRPGGCRERPRRVPATRPQPWVHGGAAERLSPHDQPAGHRWGSAGSKYYEFGTTRNPTFGYVQVGPVFAVPLACIPKSFGTWTVKGAAEFVFLGDTLKPLNGNEVFKPIGRIGIAAVY